MYLLSILSASCLFVSATHLKTHDPATELEGSQRAAQGPLAAAERQLISRVASRSEIAAIEDMSEGRQKSAVPGGAGALKATAATTAALSFLAIAGFAFARAGFRKRR